MTTKRNAPDYTVEIVNENRKSTQEFNSWTSEVTRALIIIGTGSPDGLIDAAQGQLYMDQDGATGTLLYIKKLAGIGNDSTLGWELV